jgi:hypothetical protein
MDSKSMQDNKMCKTKKLKLFAKRQAKKCVG